MEKTKGIAVKKTVLLLVKRGSDSTKCQQRTGHSVQGGGIDILHPQRKGLLLMLNVFCLSLRARAINLTN